MLKLLIAITFSAPFFAGPEALLASAATDGILIRQALEKERFGRRRGDAELAVGICSPRFVAYDGAGTEDMIAWTVKYGDRDSFSAALDEDLTKSRYDVIRSVASMTVIENEAFVTVVDSGHVIDRQSGERRLYRSKDLWRFRKVEENWQAIALVSAIGDTTAGPFTGGNPTGAEEVVETLMDDAGGWSAEDAGAILSNLDENFTAFDSYDKFGASAWLVVFENPKLYEEWLKRRFGLTDYEVDRKVVHVSLEGDEALAVTADNVSTSYQLGSAKHSKDRHVFWRLSKQDGSWKITDMVLNTRHVK